VLAQQEYEHMFHGNKYSHESGITFIRKNEQRGGENMYTRVFRCYFHTEPRGSCQFVIRYVRNVSNGQYQFYIGSTKHSEHCVSCQTQIRLEINSPSVFNKSAPKFVQDYMVKHPDTANEEMNKVNRFFGTLKRKVKRSHLGPLAKTPNTFAAVLATLNHWTRDVVLEREFGPGGVAEGSLPDTMWICPNADNLNFDLQQPNTTADDPRVVVVFTTDELVLNAYRQWYHTGKTDLHFQIDASYKYTTQKRMGYIPIKTLSHCQKGHTVAYAVINTEDTVAHKHILGAVKAAVERIVNERIDRGDKYC
jgi:hypothetical protein